MGFSFEKECINALLKIIQNKYIPLQFETK
jgi:hypothetical protein